LKNYILV